MSPPILVNLPLYVKIFLSIDYKVLRRVLVIAQERRKSPRTMERRDTNQELKALTS